MSNGKNSSEASSNWTSKQTYILAVICLILGGVAGYLLRGSSSSDNDGKTMAASTTGMPAGLPAQPPTPEQLAQMVRKQAEPLLERLKSWPNDPSLLASLGNLYYDAQQYEDAIGYYKKLLKIQPENVDIRSDMATCYWYKNDPDTAISEFEKSLSYNPKHASTLYNLGVVKWQGKGDPDGAVKVWQKLLETNPNYENKTRVMELISRARQHAAGGFTKTKG